MKYRLMGKEWVIVIVLQKSEIRFSKKNNAFLNEVTQFSHLQDSIFDAALSGVNTGGRLLPNGGRRSKKQLGPFSKIIKMS